MRISILCLHSQSFSCGIKITVSAVPQPIHWIESTFKSRIIKCAIGPSPLGTGLYNRLTFLPNRAVRIILVLDGAVNTEAWSTDSSDSDSVVRRNNQDPDVIQCLSFDDDSRSVRTPCALRKLLIHLIEYKSCVFALSLPYAIAMTSDWPGRGWQGPPQFSQVDPRLYASAPPTPAYPPWWNGENYTVRSPPGKYLW